MWKYSKSLILAAIALVSLSTHAAAQVAVSVGVEEIYDTNIYLENSGKPRPIPTEVSAQGDSANLDPYDGDLNDDFITNVYITASGLVEATKYLKIPSEIRFGNLFFASQSDETRLILDSNLSAESTEELLPKPWHFKLGSVFSSQSANIAVSEGATARSSESHTLSFDAGAKAWEFAPNWDWTTVYQFRRVDYLESFLWDSDKGYEEDGSDYMSNGAQIELGHKFSEKLRGAWTNELMYQTFTDSEANQAIGLSSDDLDRFNYVSKIGLFYQVSDKFSVDGDIGVDGSYYPDREASDQVVIVNPDGTRTVVTPDSDDSELGLTFALNGTYLLSDKSSLTGGLEQRSGTNIDGRRVMDRAISLAIVQSYSERTSSTFGGRYSQFTYGDSFSSAGERYELTFSVNYAVTKALALSAGYNFVDQSVDDSNVGSMLSDDEDYKASRIFLGISTGLVGTGTKL